MKDNSIAKQAFWFNMINYIGVVIGVVYTLMIRNLWQVDSRAQMLYTIVFFGSSQTSNDYHQKVINLAS